MLLAFVLLLVAAGYGLVYYLPLTPELFEFSKKILMVLAVLGGTFAAAKIATGFVNFYAEKGKGVLPSTTIFANLTRLLILALGGLIILQSLGISITPILTALGVGGLAVALALQDTLSNLFSGLHILLSRQLRPGDYVKLDSGEEGYVQDITWRNTTIRTLSNNMSIVPNSKLASAVIVNFNQPEKEMSVLVPVGVSYESDLKKVEKVTIEVVKETLREVEGGLESFDPFIRYHTFAGFSINFYGDSARSGVCRSISGQTRIREASP